MADDKAGSDKSPGFIATVSAVFGAFIGIRKQRDYERDAAQFKPVHLILAGIIGGVIFVVSIVMIARLVVSRAAG